MKTVKSILFYFLTTILVSSANAQIVYTDVNPDTTINNISIGIYHLDLNNDGINDYDIKIHSSSAGICSTRPLSYKTNHYTVIQPLNNNEILSDAESYPLALNQNVQLQSGSSVWSNSSSQILSGINWHCRVINYRGIHHYWSSSSYGNWGSVDDKYIGLKLHLGNKIYYGWLRMVAGSGSFTVKDYAFDSTPNHKIHTGATTGARLVSQNSFSEIFESFQLQIIPNPFIQSTVISWTSEKAEKVYLKIFDLNGRLIKTLADNVFDVGEHSVVWNAEDVKTGIYFLQMQTGDFFKTEKIIATN